MSAKNTVMQMAWGAVIDDTNVTDFRKCEKLDSAGKALTNAFVAGPPIPVESSDVLSFFVRVDTKDTMANVQALVELSFDGQSWFPHTSGIGLLATAVAGVAPNQVIEQEALPLIRKYVVAADGSGFAFDCAMRARFARLSLKCDVAGPAGLVRAFAGV